MSLLLKVKPLVISPALAQRIGLNEAIVLQQICYWLEDTTSGVEHDGKRWIYNTIEDWNEQFPWWSSDTVKRALTSLKKSGLIYVEQLKKTQHDRTNFYAINHANPLLADEGKLPSSKDVSCTHRKGQAAPIDKGSLTPSMGANCTRLTENTTENTTEITTTPSCQVATQPDHAPDANQAAFSVLDHLNRAAGMRFQKSKSSLAPIRGRLAEDFTADELILTVDYSIAKWAEDPKMCEYVRPETIFRPGKFPGYLSSAQKWDKAGRPKCINGKWQRDVMAVSQVDTSTPEGFRGA
ncbi:conserved phage C-terminal domain-containing protein [Enterobacteriaceae bacterium EKM102V]|uniref:conserved phage C-terminal domain-containing protein n=1 Tax=Pantoea TaxID=53335 RepID=UPI00142DFE2A|nr:MULTISPECIES: conserved phage C-terminal domain-containing protein [Pantoea]KAF6661283.1 conserved phage C-terminal domain-containing protein [Enterobacteriaceae bacterium EKM102V]KAF6668208.1 conserved phage C-terminal domain-containing protein [Pantoea sp. EKM103V]